MTSNADQVYDFVFKGLLTEEALDRAGRKSSKLLGLADDEIAESLSIDLLDDELVASAKRMAVVYTAIAAFKNSVRNLLSNILLEERGENWWEECVSEKIRKRAEARMADEQKVRWHTRRGDDPINYTLMSDLINIIRDNWDKFEPHLHSAEWAASILAPIERSRNAIMHSSTLDREDIERVGIYIRDWTKQVGS